MPILIRGETGTGKEQLARHAHVASGRTGAFVPVNCAALPESLIEAELFGYAEGAFTGARRDGAIGLVKEADGGTLFLDEIGDMPVALQAVLLRLLDDWTVRPVGGVRTKVDVFLISATNASLDKAIAEGRFRSDLLYRLNTLEVTLPRLARSQRLRRHRSPSACRYRSKLRNHAGDHRASRRASLARQHSRTAQYAGTLHPRRDWRLDRRSRRASHDRSGPADGGRIAPRYPARPDPGGLCRNRWKHQRNRATSRCFKKYHLPSPRRKKAEMTCEILAGATGTRFRRRDASLASDNQSSSAPPPSRPRRSDRSRPASWRSAFASSGSGRRRRPHCEPRCSRP